MIKGFGLRNIKTGELARLHVTSNEGYDCCGSETYELTEYSGPENSIYITSFESAVVTKIESTPWYNSSEDRPTWGGFSIENYEVVSIEIPDPIVEKVEYKIPPPLSDFYEGRPYITEYQEGVAFVGTLKSVPPTGTIVYVNNRGFIEVIEKVEGDIALNGKSYLIFKGISSLL
jgi:hypothetical protein